MSNKPKAILIGVELWGDTSRFSLEESLMELNRLADTARIEVISHVTQKRSSIHPGYFIGKGKANELAKFCHSHGCDMVIFDDELSPAQTRNLEYLLDLTVWDRTGLILEIFEARAHSREAKLQVELARLEYMLPRLVGRGESYSRIGGGIGARGKGEQKIEIDRRHVREQIQEIRSKLAEVKKQRMEKRSYRKKHGFPVVSLVGYTNAGKSTLLSKLTGTDVTAKDELFNTLDPKLAKLSLNSGTSCLLSDTVGFINKLPHHLVAAFRATLEEVEEADLILHVIDSSSERMDEEVEAAEEVLSSLDVDETPVIQVFNKMDLLSDPDSNLYSNFPREIPVSAVEEKGLEDLKRAIQNFLEKSWVRENFEIPYHRQDLRAYLHEKGEVLEILYEDNLMDIYARIPPHEVGRIKKELQEDNE